MPGANAQSPLVEPWAYSKMSSSSIRASSVLLRDRVPCILGKTWRTLFKLAVSVLKFQSTQCTERCRFRLGGRRRFRRNAPSPFRQIGCYRVVRRTARLVAPSRAGIRRTAVEWQLADAERLDRRAGPGGQRAPARRLQVLRAVPYHPLSNPPLPHRARPRAAGDDCLLLAALAVEVCTPGYPHPATLARRAVRAEAEASRLIMVRQPCPGGTPSPTICEARQIEVDCPRQVRQAALQAALAGASTPRLARGC